MDCDSPEIEEGRLIEGLMMRNTPPKEGDEWYVLNNAWWCAWKAYTGYQGMKTAGAIAPGVISNEEILKEDYISQRTFNAQRKLYADMKIDDSAVKKQENYVPKDDLYKDIDFVMVPKDVWDIFVNKYGTASVAVPRYAYRVPGTNKIEIDIPQMEILLSCPQRKGIYPGLRLSRHTTVRELKTLAMKLFLIDPDKYDNTTNIFFNGNQLREMSYRICEYSRENLVKASVESSYLEPLYEDPPQHHSNITKLGYTVSSYDSSRPLPQYYAPPSQKSKMKVPGLCGLENLGNTCYMNSAIQCLSNTVPFADYIVSEKFKSEINDVNPIGSHGKVIGALATTLRHMWEEGGADVYSPTEFKKVIGEANGLYEGYSQQDVRSFIECVLTELHDDVNRVRDKKYRESSDYKGEPIEEWAKESWGRSLERDDSFIVDMFTGQVLDSTCCPACGFKTVTFGNFNVNTVYIPNDEIKVTLAFNGLKGAKGLPPMKVLIPWEKEDTVESLAQAIAKYCNTKFCNFEKVSHLLPVAPEDIVVMGVNEFDVLTVKSRSDRVSNSSVVSLYASIVDERTSQENVRVPFAFYNCRGTSFGAPYFVTLKRDAFYVDVAAELLRTFSVFTKPGVLEEYLGCPPEVADLGNPEMLKLFSELLSINGESFIAPGGYVSISENNVLSVCLTERGTSFVQKEWLNEVEKESGQLTLEQCLGFRNGTTFILDDKNKWTCGQCKRNVNAIKQSAFWRLPPVVIFCLNRFDSLDGTSAKGKKLDKPVQFPITNFNLSPFVQGPEAAANNIPLYDLCAVSCHSGSMKTGHYTAYAKNKKDKKWYLFNDSSVREVSSPAIDNAYILFYTRKDFLKSTDIE